MTGAVAQPGAEANLGLEVGHMYRLSGATRWQPMSAILVIIIAFWDHVPLFVHVWLLVHYVSGTFLFDRLRAGWAAVPKPAARAASLFWRRRFTLGSIYTGAVWGTIGVVYFAPDVPALMFLVALILLGIITSAIAYRSIHLPTYAWFAGTAMGPFMVRCMLEGGETGALGLLGFIYFWGVFLWARAAGRDMRQALALQTENSELVGQLQNALAEAERARARAEQASLNRTEFLANMSHELRTPLNGIIGMAGLLAATRLDSRQMSFAEAVRKSGESLLTIINDVLDLARLEAEKVEFERIDFDLRETANGVCELLAPRAHEKGVEIEAYYSPALPDVLLGDVGRVRQVLLNLAGNAVKFTEGGHVHIEVAPVPEQPRRMRIAITDTGPGVDASAEPHLFTRFGQGDRSITRRYGGTGLGLAIAKRLVAAMGGEIGYERLATGSRFWFTLPLEAVASAAVKRARLDGRHIGVRPRAGGSGLLVRKLVDEGARVAQLGADPADWLDTLDTVLFDVGDDGTSVAGELAAIRSARPGLRCVVLVPASRAASLPEAPAPFDARVLKPFRRAALMEPLVRREEEVAVPRPLAAQARTADLVVLVVDDLEVNRLLLSSLLTGAGHRVETADDGDSAVARVQSGGIDLVFMDLEMPRLHGIAAASAIRRLPGHAGRVPIVAVSAHFSTEYADRCRAAGFDAMLEKPIDVDALERAISSLLSGDASATVGRQHLNRAGLDRLAAVMDGAKLADLLRSVSSDLDRRIGGLAGQIGQGAITDIRREAHIVKGLAANFAMPDLAGIADDLLDAARQDDAGAAAAIHERMQSLWAGLRAELSAYADSLAADGPSVPLPVHDKRPVEGDQSS